MSPRLAVKGTNSPVSRPFLTHQGMNSSTKAASAAHARSSHGRRFSRRRRSSAAGATSASSPNPLKKAAPHMHSTPAQYRPQRHSRTLATRK